MRVSRERLSQESRQWLWRNSAWTIVLLSLAVQASCGGTTAIGGFVPRRLSIEAVPQRLVIRREPTDIAVLPVINQPFVEPLEAPYLLPYQPVEIMSDFYDCRGRRRRHEGIDFAGLGEDAGLGTRVGAVGHSRIIMIGRSSDDPRQFGRPLRRGRTTVRGGQRLPVSAEIEGYGEVFFFTRNYGSWHSGTVLVTELLDGPLQGFTVRYMHLGAVAPDLSVGDVLQAGEEVGLLGGTGVQESPPHLHLDAHDTTGEAFDLAPFLGLQPITKETIPDC